MSADEHKVCYGEFTAQYTATQQKHHACKGEQYMLVRMTLKEEENLKLLNDKNQAFTRVAKYYKEEDHIIVLLFTSYKFKVPVEEAF